MHRAAFLTGLAALLLAGNAVAQLQDENLLIGMPAGYKIGFQERKGPIVMTEMADSAPNGKMVQRLTDWADARAVSYFAWAWNSWADPGPYYATHLTACGSKAVCK